MKKTVGMLCSLTILSACGTGLDFWNDKQKSLVGEPRHQPSLNGTPQSAPVSLNNRQAPRSYAATSAPKALPLGSPVPAPLLNQAAPIPAQQIAYNSNMPSSRRLPEYNRNALGSGDLLGPAPAPAVSRKQLDPNTPVASVTQYQPPVIPVQKLQSVALNMPNGLVIPAAPAKNAKAKIAIPQQTQTAKSQPEIHSVEPLQSVASNMPQGKVVPPVPPRSEQAEVPPAPPAEESVMPKGPTIVVGDASQPNKETVAAAPVVEVKKVDTMPVHDVANLESVAHSMPKGSIVAPAPAKVEPVVDIHDVPALQASAQNMPQGSIFPPVPAVAPAPIVVENYTPPPIAQTSPIPSVADNMPRDGIVPPPARIMATQEEQKPLPPAPQLSDVQVQTFPPLPELVSNSKGPDVMEKPKLKETPKPKPPEPQLVAQATDSDIPPPAPIMSTPAPIAAKTENTNIGSIIQTETVAEGYTKPEIVASAAPDNIMPAPIMPEPTKAAEIMPAPPPLPTPSVIEPMQRANLTSAPAPIAATNPIFAPAPGPVTTVTSVSPAPIISAQVTPPPAPPAQIIAAAPPPPPPAPIIAAAPPPAPVAAPAPIVAAAPITVPQPVPVTTIAAAPAPMVIKPKVIAETKVVKTEEFESIPAVPGMPGTEIKTLEPMKRVELADNNTYPILASMPPSPPTPQPADNDPRVQQMKEELKKAQAEQAKADAGQETAKAPAPVPPAPQTTATKLAALPDLPAPPPSKPVPKIITTTTTVTQTAAPAPVEKPKGLMPEGPTIVVRSDETKTVRTEVAPAPAPQVAAAPVAPPTQSVIVPMQRATPTSAPAPIVASVQAKPSPIAAATPGRGAPAGFLVPPAATATPPVFVPVHSGASTSSTSTASNNSDSSNDSDAIYTNVQPDSNTHSGLLAPSRYEKLRQNQSNGSGY